MAQHRIAVLPGDGIGKEVMPEGLRVLEAAARKFGIDLAFTSLRLELRLLRQARRMMPEDWLDAAEAYDAIFYGAVGWPATVPDHVSLWGSLIPFRRDFDQYVNMRPCKLMPGIPSPLANRKPGDIDFVVVRENTEGEYSSVGGRMYEGTDREIVFQQSCFSRKGVDRIMRYAFELARTRAEKHVTSATKSNGISITMPYWDERFRAMGAGLSRHAHRPVPHRHPVRALRAAAASASTWWWPPTCSATSSPTSGPRCAARSASRRRPTSIRSATFPSLFEPVHGSAPDIAGKGIANPIGQIWSGAMMLDFLGHKEAGAAIVAAIERVLADKDAPRTPDLGGKATTADLGKAIAAAL